MNPVRMVYEHAPAFIPVPADLQHQRVEAIFWRSRGSNGNAAFPIDWQGKRVF